jgi:hypothetical protein
MPYLYSFENIQIGWFEYHSKSGSFSIYHDVSGYFMTTLKLTNYRVLSTGADGGHRYISTVIQHKGVTRQLTALFKSKSDENKLSENMAITVSGNLIDEGLQQSLMLLDTEIIDGQ